MTKQEFSKAHQLSRKAVTVGISLFTVLWISLFLIVGNKLKERFGGSDAVGLSWIAISLVLFIAGVICIAKFVHKRCGLVCPSCGDWIASQQTMLKTGKCPKCKKEIFHDV